MYVSRSQQLRDILALSQKTHTIGKSGSRDQILNLGQISFFLRPLRASHHPARPARQVAEMSKRLNVKLVALPWLQPACLDDNDIIVRCSKLAPESSPAPFVSRARRDWVIQQFRPDIRIEPVKSLKCKTAIADRHVWP